MLDGLPIITERLILNAFDEADAPFLHQLMTSPDYLEFIGDRGIKDEQDAAKYIKEKLQSSYLNHGFGFFLVRLRHMDFPIGLCGIVKRDQFEQVDLGFAFLSDYQGQGYGYESAKAVIEYAKEEHNMEKLIAITSHENDASKNLLIRLGFTYDKEVDWSEEEKVLEYRISL